jgi:hypothetical protein
MPLRPERTVVTFLFRRQERVYRYGDWRTYTIRRQRYVTREVMPPLVEYLLDGEEEWTSEADLLPVEEDARAEGLPP